MLPHPVDFARASAAVSRSLRTVLVFDVVESVRIMAAHEDAFVDCWRARMGWLRGDLLPRWRGRLVKSHGDGGLAEFSSAWDAVNAALELQASMLLDDAQMPADALVRLRIGIHVCEVIVDELDLYGSGVNLAARIAASAEPGAVVVSADVQDRLADGAGLRLTDLGEHWLKHFDRPHRLYRVSGAGDIANVRVGPWGRYEHRPTIAVLPLSGMSGDGFAGALGLAVVDEVIGTLARSPHWRVISRLSTARCVDTPSSVRLASVLGVQYVVSGTYRAAEDRAIVKLQLADMRSEEVLWSGAAEIAPRAMMTGEDPALHQLTREIGLRLLRTEVRRACVLPFSSIEDYGLHIGAIALMHRLGSEDVERARDIIDALEERHRRSAEPVAMRSRWHAVRMVQAGCEDPAAQARLALAYARQALERDATHPFAMPMAALLGAQSGEPLQPAVRLGEAAVAEHPQEPLAHLALALLNSYAGDVASYEHHAQEAVALSPIDPAGYILHSVLASAKLAAGKADDAAHAASRAIDMNATYSSAHLMMCAAQALSGRWDLARQSALRVLQLEPEFRVGRYLEEFGDRRPPDAERRAEALRQAGLPD